MPIYFAQCVDGGPIKIGFSEKPEERVRDFSRFFKSKVQLLAVIPGSLRRELRMHRKLKRFRASGISSCCYRTEWYEPVPDILQLVLRAGGFPVLANDAKDIYADYAGGW